MIKFQSISKKFPNNTHALVEVDLGIGDNEFVFIIGPSGAGKTTLLKLITREILPTDGKILVGEADITQFSPNQVAALRRKIGVIFQDYKLLADRNVFENVALSLEVIGKPEKQIAKETKEILAQVGMLDKAELFPQQLSGGESQRTAIARAVIGDPEIILADEPTADLDPATAWEIINLLNQINKKGATVVMATHNADIVNTLKKRVVKIDHGRIIADAQKGKYVSH